MVGEISGKRLVMCQDVNDNHGKNLWLWIPVFFSLFIILLIGGFYFYEFRDFVQDNAVWGQFGDYFGGIVNPILTFISMILVVFTLRTSEKQLKQADITSKEQSDSIKLQNFENSFFKLISLHNDIVENMADAPTHPTKFKRESFISFVAKLKENYKNILIAYGLDFTDEEINDAILKNNLVKEISKEIEKKHLIMTNEEKPILKSEEIKQAEKDRIRAEMFKSGLTKLETYGSKQKAIMTNFFYQDFLMPNGILVNHYFRNIYQILKFVHCQKFDENEEKNHGIKKQYTNILRAQLSSFEATLLFYNCLSEQGDKLTPLVKKYDLLKHLEKHWLIDENNFSLKEKLTQNSYHYIVNKTRYNLENNKITVTKGDCNEQKNDE